MYEGNPGEIDFWFELERGSSQGGGELSGVNRKSDFKAKSMAELQEKGLQCLQWKFPPPAEMVLTFNIGTKLRKR